MDEQYQIEGIVYNMLITHILFLIGTIFYITVIIKCNIELRKCKEKVEYLNKLLREPVDCDCKYRYVNGENERIWLAEANSSLRSQLRSKLLKFEDLNIQLEQAGNRLVEALSWDQSFPYDAATTRAAIKQRILEWEKVLNGK